MKVSELIEHLKKCKNEDDVVVIELTDSNVFPAHAQVGIRSLWPGIDWDRHKVFLKPERRVNIIEARSKDTSMLMIKEGRSYACPVCLRIVAYRDWYCRHCGQRIVQHNQLGDK